jgi:hypothetical protein
LIVAGSASAYAAGCLKQKRKVADLAGGGVDTVAAATEAGGALSVVDESSGRADAASSVELEVGQACCAIGS